VATCNAIRRRKGRRRGIAKNKRRGIPFERTPAWDWGGQPPPFDKLRAGNPGKR
jgi:hypothetical protein